MKKTSFHTGHINEDMSLQITSMADIFIIILVFLLKSHATGTMNVTTPAGMSLPSSHIQDASVEGLKITISKTSVQMEGDHIAELDNFLFTKPALQPGGPSNPLAKAFGQVRKRQLANTKPTATGESRIIIIADKRAPFSTIKTVMASAAMNGYTDFKLATVRGD
ncbi:MAG: biopolymer transporter ExbD [Bdellovibrionota bacterium]